MGSNSMVESTDIELHIQELLLQGFARGDRFCIVESMKNELARLLAENGLPGSFSEGFDLPSLDGGSFTVGAGERPESVGAAIGQAIYRGMWRRAEDER